MHGNRQGCSHLAGRDIAVHMRIHVKQNEKYAGKPNP